MQELITKSWNGFEIEFELIDGQLMANATSMCAAFGKLAKDWLKTASAKRFIEAKRTKILLAESQMVFVRSGGNASGTWIHESLIRKLAEWLNVDFEVQCDEWVTELLRTGQVALKPKSSLEVLSEMVQNLIEQDKRLSTIEQKVEEVSARQVVTEVNHYAIVGWAKLRKVSLTKEQAKAFGVKAAALSKQRDVPIEKVPNGTWGTVNSYHRSILQDIF